MKTKFSILQMTYWCGYGAFAAYLTPYLISQGFSPITVGSLMSIYTLFAMFGQLICGSLSDKIKSVKKIYIYNHLLTILSIIALYNVPNEYKNIFVCILGLVQLPMPALLDAWILKYYHTTPEQYGPIRAFGSLSFAIFSLGFGFAVEAIGFIILPICSISLFLTSFFITLISQESNTETVSKNTNSFRYLLKKNSFKAIIVVSILIGLSATTLMNMQSYIVYDVNAKEASIGICMSIAAFAQVPIMFCYHYLKKINNRVKIISAILLYTFSYIIMFISNNIFLIYISMIFNGFAFGLYLPAIREYVSTSIPINNQTSCLSILDTCQNYLGSSIGILMSGYLINTYGVKMMLLSTIFISCLAISIMVYQEVKKHE